jgi:hypothetical protein
VTEAIFSLTFALGVSIAWNFMLAADVRWQRKMKEEWMQLCERATEQASEYLRMSHVFFQENQKLQIADDKDDADWWKET